MRAITCVLWQNLGTGAIGNTLSVFGTVTRLGVVSQVIDEQLTKVKAGEITVEVNDPTGAIWTFVQTELALNTAQAVGLLPPYLQLLVAGQQVFLGIVDPSRIVYHQSADVNSIEFGAQDWSIQLANSYLGSQSANPWLPSTAYTAGNPAATPIVPPSQVILNDSLYICIASGTSGTTGPIGDGVSITDGSVTWAYVPPGWARTPPKASLNSTPGSPITGYSAPLGQMVDSTAAYTLPQYATTVFFTTADFVSVMDLLTCDNSNSGLGLTNTVAGVTFIVIQVLPTVPNPFGSSHSYPEDGHGNLLALTPVVLAQLSPESPIVLGPWGFTNLAIAYLDESNVAYPGVFTHASATGAELDYFTVQQAVPLSPPNPVNVISLNSVDGIFPQDALTQVHGSQASSWTVLGINPELNCVQVSGDVTNLNIGDGIYFDAATDAEQVMVDARQTLQLAAYPFQVDTSRLVRPTLPMPVFGWLALQGLKAVSDIEPTTAGTVKVFSGLTNAYIGGPDIPWIAQAPTTLPASQPQLADWTQQLASAPASMMPYTVRSNTGGTQGDSPWSELRNRVYNTSSFVAVDNGPVPWFTPLAYNSSTPPWSGYPPLDPAIPSTWFDPFGMETVLGYYQFGIPTQIFYDYLLMRKVIITTTNTLGTISQTIQTQAWSGTAWGSLTTVTWPSGNIIVDISNFPGAPSGVMVGLTMGGTLEYAIFNAGAIIGSKGIPNLLQNGSLVPTLHGVALVGGPAYGWLTYAAGVYAFTYAILAGQVDVLWPQTFVARTATEAVCLGRLDDQAGGKTESWLFRLSLPPVATTPLSSIVLSEPIGAGTPTFAGAILDPTKAGRVVGHWAGQLWQVDTVAPWTIERWTPNGMSALEACEHIAQLFGAMCIPQPNGYLAIVSRDISETAIALTVIIAKNDQSLCWQDFYSTVRTTTADGKTYWDAPSLGGQVGGKLLEISNHPMLWSLSQCGAMAENMATWFNVPRAMAKQTWTYPDPNTAPPWEGLPAFAKVTVNGTGPWRVMSMEQDFIAGTAEVLLIQDNN